MRKPGLETVIKGFVKTVFKGELYPMVIASGAVLIFTTTEKILNPEKCVFPRIP